MSINVVAIMGNLGHDAELKVTQSGTQVLHFSVCVNDRRKQGGEWVDVPNWVDCVMFGRRAEAVSGYLTKGTKVAVRGRLSQSRWQDKDGRNRSKLEVVAEDVEFSGGRPERPESPEVTEQPDVYDEDIPF